jgi:hypothetical protein
VATGRTKHKWWKVYVNGYDMSGYSRTLGPLEVTHEEADLTADMGDTIRGYLKNHTQVNVGTLNAVFDNTATSGLQAVIGTAGNMKTVLAAIGIRAAPAAGDPCFGGQFAHEAFQTVDDGGAVTVTAPFTGWAADSTSLLHGLGFGQLLHASGAETGANAGSGFDNLAGSTSTTAGGYMVYHVLDSSNASHTATLSIDDSANNSTWLALSGATTGSITVTAGVSGIIALSPTATVRRYLRWQLALGTATSVTFVLAFMRG